MGRRTDENRVRAIVDYVRDHPGARPAEIARDLEMPRSTVGRALPALESAGQLLSEDQHGGLWPFRKGR